MNKLNNLRLDLKKAARKERADVLKRFFKTGKGEYGEGDIFLGIPLPEQRAIVGKYKDLEIKDIEKLIKSKYHEERLTALLIAVEKFKKANYDLRFKIYDFYLKNTKYINNWDLVDVTADRIVGAYLENKDKAILYKLARSKLLWERRIAIMATFHYIKQGNPKETLKIAKILLNDKQDLIHKAVGWMLREIGERCGEEIEEKFLCKYYQIMPRTMLRYAIERFSPEKRKFYMAK